MRLALVFSEAMDQASLELTSTPPIALGAAAWNVDGTSVAFANDDLAASTSYILALNAKDVAGNPLAATTLVFTTSDSADRTAPSTPTGLAATPSDGRVTLTWQANPEADVAGYTVYVGVADDALEPSGFVSGTTETITGLTNGTRYSFAVDAVDASNNRSSKTAAVRATPADTTPPILQASDPEDNATDVAPRDPAIELVFSEPMATADFEFTIQPPFVASDSVPDEPLELTWSFDDTVVTIRPSLSDLVPENTRFTLTVTQAEDEAGNALSGDNQIAFTTGEEAPKLVSSTPADGATDVPIEPFEIELVFSKPMASAEVEATLAPVDVFFYSEGWQPTWSADRTVLTLTATLDPGYFLEDTTYTLVLTGASDAGKSLAETTVTFNTIDDITLPTIVSTSPTGGTTDRPLSPLDVFVYFDDLMNAEATLAALSSSTALPCEWQHFFTTDSANDATLESAFACRSSTEEFQAGTTYTITVGAGAKDTSGNALAAPFSFSFTTVAVE